jgi:hypothetical protein
LGVADDQPALAAKERQQNLAEPGVAAVEHADMPGPAFAHEHRREAVHCDEDRRSSQSDPGVQLGAEAVVARPEGLAPAGIGVVRAEPLVAGNAAEIARASWPARRCSATRRRGCRLAG